MLGVLCATVGSVQANEAVKLLCGIGDPLVGRLLIYDALELSFKDIAVRKDPECAVRGKNPTVTELIDYEEFCGVVSDEAQQAAAGATLTPGPAQVAARRRPAAQAGGRPRAGRSGRSTASPGRP